MTLVNKGNIMKFTEAPSRTGLPDGEGGVRRLHDPRGRGFGEGLRKAAIVIKDRSADSMFHSRPAAPEEYSVIARPNLNGDTYPPTRAAQVGGLGIAPDRRIDEVAISRPPGTAQKYAARMITPAQ